MGALALAGAAFNVKGLLSACFARGTKLWTPEGYRPIEEIKPGDSVYSRDEFDPEGPIVAKEVQATFERIGFVLHLHVEDRVIRTTGEHPFYAEGKGWTNARELAIGDRVLGSRGEWLRVSDLLETGEYEAVFNLAVADCHTYFVGEEGWEWEIWAHNLNCSQNAALLRKALTAAGRLSKYDNFAAHLVPTGKWARRKVASEVANIQRILNEGGVGLNSAANGFFTNARNQLGTHTDDFIRELNRRLSAVAGDSAAIRETLHRIRLEVLSGVYL